MTEPNTATNKPLIDALALDDVRFVDDKSAAGVTKGATLQQVLDLIEANISNVPAGMTIGDKAIKFAGKETIWIPAAAMIASTTSGAATAQLETSANKVNYKVFDFDASADEFVHFDIAFPKSWNEGTVTFQAFWESTATDTDGVAWGLQGVFVSDNVAADTAYGTAIVVTDLAQSAAGELYVTGESAAITIAGTPAVDGIVNFRLLRDVSDAVDVMTEDARLRGVKVFFTTDAGNDD